MNHLINRAYKFRAYPTKKQEELIIKTFGCSRFIYNYYLAKSIQDYEETGKSNSFYQNAKDSTQLKNKLIWLKEADGWAITNALKDLDSAYQNFFRRVKQGQTSGFPKFKKKCYSKQSYRTTKNNKTDLQINNSRIKLPKVGWLRIKQDREVIGKVVNATVSKSASGRYYVSICCVDSEVEYLEPVNSTIGIDVGLKDFAVFSTGEKIENPKFLRKSEKRLKKFQRKFSKKQKGSKNREKARIQLARQYEKVSNQRKDFLHKLTTDLIKNHDIICCEDLNVAGMLKNHHLAKSTADASWSKFYNFLSYKSNWYSRKFIQIDRFYPSSQLCSNCGYPNKEVKDLSIRQWTCPNCGTTHDRDHNASKNILSEGLRIAFA